MTIGELIRQKRLAKGFTLSKFSRAINLSMLTISRLERDELNFSDKEKWVEIVRLLELDEQPMPFAINQPLTVDELIKRGCFVCCSPVELAETSTNVLVSFLLQEQGDSAIIKSTTLASIEQ